MFVFFQNDKEPSNLKPQLTKRWVKVVARFPKFLDDKSRLFIARLSSDVEFYSKDERETLKKIILNAYRAQQIHSNKIADLLFLAETTVETRTVTGVMVIDKDLVNDYQDLVKLLSEDNIVELII